MVGQARLSAPRLEVRDLWGSPAGTHEPVVRGESFEAAAGEWIAVTGPNGCGKTTLAHAIVGLLPFHRGAVLVDGRPLGLSSEERARARVAVVLQEPSSQLFERTVRDEISFAPRNLGWAESRVREATIDWSRRLGLDRELDFDPRTLSAGRQQMVLIAAALATDPALLVSDEGAAHLDPASRYLVLSILRDKARSGMSIVWVTQHPAEIEAADRTLRMVTTGSRELSRESDEARPPDQAVTPGAHGALHPTLRARGALHSTPRARGALHPATRVDGGESLAGAQALDVTLMPMDGAASGPLIRLGEELRFRLEPGRIVALTGPNGSGKTVVLESIAGLMDVPQVKVSWSSPPARTPVLSSQYPDLQIVADTVRREIEFGAEKRGANARAVREVVDDLFRTFELDRSLLSRSPWELSSGERRLVQLIAALVTPTHVVLLDEPTGGVDATRSERIARVILSRSNASAFLIASQDEAWLDRLHARRVALGN